MYERVPLDDSAAIRFTDQAMLGWLQALCNRDPIEVGLDKIVHKGIITDSTNKVIDTLKRSGQSFGGDGLDVFQFGRGEEGFDELMGTIHGTRTAHMLTESVLTPITFNTYRM